MRIFFDVGANNGSSSIKEAEADPNTTVYAFEPTPHLINIIEAQTAHLPNYILTKKAVSDYEGKATFNIAGMADWGCSSLLTFSPHSKTQWRSKPWGYGDHNFQVTETIEVDVIRLDNFVQQHNITSIDYLHIDTQGSDLKVLQGLAKLISIVKAGVMEAASREEILYLGQNTLVECIEFLNTNNFNITKILPNDPFSNEMNIFFEKR